MDINDMAGMDTSTMMALKRAQEAMALKNGQNPEMTAGSSVAQGLGQMMPAIPELGGVAGTAVDTLAHPDPRGTIDWWQNLLMGGRPKQSLAGSKQNQEVVNDPEVMPQY